uniref:Large ribosomal subunit protein bL33c n=1 Tax=Compsopogon caeruleus TaxID=31354 RepID=A0A1Z1XB18_9RHOD|nr:50S ribosomal protein L33 [Compsopogon caeruleus]ARX96018.1 50S ribosomal protein L33 [Compsopogon caeruleus]
MLKEVNYLFTSLSFTMAKNKGARIIVTLECTSNCRSKNFTQRSPGVFRYTTTKNRRNTSSKLELKKFCPKCNFHSLFKEVK